MRQSDYQRPESNPPRTRGSVLLFRGIVAFGLLAFGVFLFSLVFRHDTQWSAPTAAPTTAPVAVALPPTPAPDQKVLVELSPVDTSSTVVPAPAGQEAKPAPDAKANTAAPLFGPNFAAGDGKPSYICGANTPASNLTLQLIQMGGLDVANGFHLGIVPIGLSSAYNLGDGDYSKLVQSGEWDCVMDYVDENAELNLGVITAVVDESAGEVGIAARATMVTYEDLAGKRIGVLGSHTTKFFANYTLALLPDAARATVKIVSYETPDKALAAYLAGELDAVSLTEPQLTQAAQSSGSKRLVDTSQLRVIANAVMTSRAAIARRPELVQAFHTAWFAALKEQFDNFDPSAVKIAAWGHNAWTGVSRENAVADLRARLGRTAQATLRNNTVLAANTAPIVSILEASRAMWQAELASEGASLPAGTPAVAALIDLRYVQQSAANSALASTGKPVNGTFSLQAAGAAAVPAVQPTAVAGVTAAPVAAATAVAEPEAVAVLPCRSFSFLANSTELTPESRRLLDVCVLPALRQRAGAALLVRGSAAWPGPAGTYTEDSVKQFGASRARAIVAYLVAQGIEDKRFVVEGIAPPPERREITDTAKLASDRFVEMTLITGGL